LVRLHILFRDADTLGSLINPKVEVSETGVQRSLDEIEWELVAPKMAQAVDAGVPDPAALVLVATAEASSRAAKNLSQVYTLVATNPPYLSDKKQGTVLRKYLERRFSQSGGDLATAFLLRLR